jgi:acetylornithine deacetylase/succinyl-diaminopimelate desuccinylase-like protein
LLHTNGDLPLNVKFLVEGEEECPGSAVRVYVTDHGDRLAADVVQIADTPMFAPGIPSLLTGLRGSVYTELHAHGADRDLDSGLHGGVAPNPLNALAHVIAGLKCASSGRVTIPGFYEDVRVPDERTLAAWLQLPFDLERFRREEVGSSVLVGEQAYSVLERIWSRPTLDVHGITSGSMGARAETTIPGSASAKISMRLVPDQRAGRIFDLYRSRVLELASPGITMEVRRLHGDDPVMMSADGPFVPAARRALQQTFGRPPVLTRSGASIPIVRVFKQRLGIEAVLMGWGLPDDNLHAPNEKLSLRNFYQGIDATIRFWCRLAGRQAMTEIA